MRSRTVDMVVVSHFVAINAVMGARRDDRLVVNSLDNASITIAETSAPAWSPGNRLRSRHLTPLTPTMRVMARSPRLLFASTLTLATCSNRDSSSTTTAATTTTTVVDDDNRRTDHHPSIDHHVVHDRHDEHDEHDDRAANDDDEASWLLQQRRTDLAAVPLTVPLRTDGFSGVTPGTDAETAIAALTELGAPSEDTGWVEPLSISTCGGTQARQLSWASLSMLFGDQSAHVQGTPHFHGWSYGTVDGIGAEPIGLVTDQDIGLGDTVAGLRAAYPSVIVTPGEEGLIETTFSVDGSLGGLLTGDTDGDP